jgi:hypothetical protein
MAYYATTNANANLRNGNRGFANDHQFWSFETKSDRDAFVERCWNRNAKAVTRKEAERLFRSQFYCVGKTPPSGGLFGGDEYFNFIDPSEVAA